MTPPRTKTAEGKTVKFICVGKKGRDAIRKTGFEVLSSYADVMGSFDFSLASGIGKDVVSGYTHKAMDEVTSSMASSCPWQDRFLSFRPCCRWRLLRPQRLIPLQGVVRRIHLRTRSDEAPCRNPSPVRQCADIPWPAGHFRERKRCRMSAMDNATRNCDEMVGALTLLFNKTRQTSITNEPH